MFDGRNVVVAHSTLFAPVCRTSEGIESCAAKSPGCAKSVKTPRRAPAEPEFPFQAQRSQRGRHQVIRHATVRAKDALQLVACATREVQPGHFVLVLVGHQSMELDGHGSTKGSVAQ